MIEAVGLTKHYGQTRALHDLSVTVRPGQVTGFLGPNGAGKTTTMRLVLGLDHPTAGQVTVNGRSFRQLREPMREVGCTLDVRAFHGGRSARSHLLALAHAGGLPPSRVEDVLARTGLTEVAGKRTKGFSLGMSQRLGIAGALLGEPRVLMFDEPVNGLDPEGIQWIRGLLRDCAAEGRTVLVSSHLMSEMAEVADHLIVLGQGELIADLSAQELIERSGHGHVLVRSPDPDRVATLLQHHGAGVERDSANGGSGLLVTGLDAERIAELAAAEGLVLHELATQRASLERAFMELTADRVEFRGEDQKGQQ